MNKWIATTVAVVLFVCGYVGIMIELHREDDLFIHNWFWTIAAHVLLFTFSAMLSWGIGLIWFAVGDILEGYFR